MSQNLPPFDLDRFLPYRMTVAAERLSARFARDYRQRHGLSVPEWRVLVHLAHSGDVSVRDIEARVAMEKSKVSRAASRLESCGYITKTRHSGDKRLIRLALTEKGRGLMADLLPRAIAYQERIEAELGPLYDALDAAVAHLVNGGPEA